MRSSLSIVRIWHGLNHHFVEHSELLFCAAASSRYDTPSRKFKTGDHLNVCLLFSDSNTNYCVLVCQDVQCQEINRKQNNVLWSIISASARVDWVKSQETSFMTAGPTTSQMQV
jgi:hypothetical protein